MGVAKVIAYGIKLTDEFGYPYDADAAKVIKSSMKTRSPKWATFCPSAEDDQCVLGIEVTEFSKLTDFMKLHEAWELAITSAPPSVREYAKRFDPDICFLAGKD